MSIFKRNRPAPQPEQPAPVSVTQFTRVPVPVSIDDIDQTTLEGAAAYHRALAARYRAVGNEAQALIEDMQVPLSLQDDATLDRGWTIYNQQLADARATYAQDTSNTGWRAMVDVKQRFVDQYVAEYARRGRTQPDVSMIIGRGW